ncbi:hypothetical protein HGRIS_006388 [Hohenbuehelia grisea]|uniref:Uncharacterized protein n=1 Tax=Hohenbuehelia grisea TaxID=104357 RepID=A0ABR3JZR7_9AGAR
MSPTTTTLVSTSTMAHTPSSPSSSDPASSLRAAALRTIKRRKAPSADPVTISPPKPLPIPDTSIQLDYGEDDISSSPPEVTMGESTSSTANKDPEVDPGREEGEISDSDEPMPEVKASPPAPVAPSPATLPEGPRKPLRPSVDTTTTFDAKPTTPPRPAVLKVESPVAPSLLDRLVDPPRRQLSPASAALRYGYHRSLLDQALSQIDENHVRPGLALNQEQYDTAKDIVLDLLGWGVPPEYLVDCGLSREIVFYVFTELNLRLPTNLNTAGLLTFPPIPDIFPVPLHPSTQLEGERGNDKQPSRGSGEVVGQPVSSFASTVKAVKAATSPTVQVPSSSSSVKGGGFSSGFLSQPSPVSAVTAVSATSVGSSSSGSSAGGTLASLHDMERQRRQELLARKAAALASRKSKASSSSSVESTQPKPSTQMTTPQPRPGPPPEGVVQPIEIRHMPSAPSSTASSFAGPSNDDTAVSQIDSTAVSTDAAPAAPTFNAALVDDFLKSIAPSASATESNALPPDDIPMLDDSSRRHASPEEMDVDIPGLVHGSQSRHQSTTPTATDNQSFRGVQSPSALEPPPSSTSTQASTLNGFSSSRQTSAQPGFSPTDATTSPAISHNQPKTRSLGRYGSGSMSSDTSFGDISQLSGPALQRRGLKRPVASDFVDFEASGVQQSSIEANDHRTNGSNGLKRGGSFAGVSGMRRCVIDLSDSEGEGEEDGRTYSYDREGAFVDARPRARGSRYSPAGWATPPTGPPSNGIGVSPGALEEKELEIRRMRELIAKREQSRLKKLTVPRSTTLTQEQSAALTPDPNGTAIPRATSDQESIPNSPAVPEQSLLPPMGPTGVPASSEVVLSSEPSSPTPPSEKGVPLNVISAIATEDTNVAHNQDSSTSEGQTEQAARVFSFLRPCRLLSTLFLTYNPLLVPMLPLCHLMIWLRWFFVCRSRLPFFPGTYDPFIFPFFLLSYRSAGPTPHR